MSDAQIDLILSEDGNFVTPIIKGSEHKSRPYKLKKGVYKRVGDTIFFIITIKQDDVEEITLLPYND